MACAAILTRSRRWTPSLLLTLAIPLIYVTLFGAFLFREGDSDWDQILSFHELSLWNWKLYGDAKQWNPLMRGGMSLAGDPQVPVYSPSMILARRIDPAAAMKISALFFLTVGGFGTWLFARDLRLDRATAALSSALFAGNGYIVSRLAHGHVAFLGTLGLPLWLCASRRSLRTVDENSSRALRRLLLLILCGGVFFALSTDGAPMTILLLVTWVGLDSTVLAWQKRSPRPVIFFVGAIAVAAALDAVYYLPLAANALVFPRARAGVFIDPAIFFWFLVLPVRGKVLPAPANGHEFSVYIGPALTYLLIRYRRELKSAYPPDDRRRLVLVSCAMFVLGLGAWRSLADWMPPGPFDLLHRLPGFLAVGIPGRFWGYLALPLALASAVAVRRLEAETTAEKPRRLLWSAIFLFTIGFLGISIAAPFVNRKGRLIVRTPPVPSQISTIVNVPGPVGSQAARLTPTTSLMDAYNLHDYVQGRILPGSTLVVSARAPGGPPLTTTARWKGWNRIDIGLPEDAAAGAMVVLNQNFHPHWTCDQGVVTHNASGNLCLRLPARSAGSRTATLVFRDPYSIAGSRISRLSACVFSIALFFLLAPKARGPWGVASSARSSARTRGRRSLGTEPLSSQFQRGSGRRSAIESGR